MRRRLEAWLGLALVVLGLAVGLVWGRAPALVEWARARAVCIESDDWGLCGFLPDSAAITALDRDHLAPGHFPEVYWHSTLEDSAAVSRLCAVLAAHVGRDGLPAVLQANYIMASLAYTPAAGDTAAFWQDHVLPETPRRYERAGLWEAVAAGRLAGVWHPELHGRWHYDPARRLAATSADSLVGVAAAAQILVFPGSEQAWELGPWRDGAVLADELAANLDAFSALFGGPPRSIIAPDYVWDDGDEAMWIDAGIRVIQGQRQQRKASWRGLEGRVRKVVHRTLTRWWRRDRSYLDRNCIFEPVQQGDPRTITEAAARGVRDAWRRGEPAVLEAHRINFAHLDQAVARLGRRELATLLADLDPMAPIYLVDGEVADLQRRGTSWSVRGGRIVVRNLSHARRLVVVPQQARDLAAHLGGRADDRRGPLVVSLAPGETRILGPRTPSRSPRDPN
ncbi:MAG: hypothetical protein R3D98_17375 [Candidatus Krumholzibacteriia bacterium]